MKTDQLFDTPLNLRPILPRQVRKILSFHQIALLVYAFRWLTKSHHKFVLDPNSSKTSLE
jgi:hypothetical protein